MEITHTTIMPMKKANHRDDRYITVSVSDNPPWNFESPLILDAFCGVSISILSIISKELNYRFQLIFAKSPLNKFRTSDNVSYDGSPADVLLGNVMMSACPLAANPARVRDFELIAGYITRDYYISVHNRSFLDATMTSQPILTTLVWNSLQELWPGMLVAAFGLGCVTLVTNHITKRLINRRYHKPVSGGTVISVQGDSALNSESMWDRFVFMGQDALQVGFKIAASIFKQCERYRPGRFHGTNLAGLILLMYSLVTSSIMDARLSSSLTASPFVPPFQSVSEFVTSNFVPLLQAGTIQLALMNSSGLREVLPKVMIYDSGSSVDKFVDYATTLSQTSNIALIATEETAVFLKGGFIPVTPTNLFGFIAIFQLPHQSPFARNITELMDRLAKTGILQHFIDLHKTIGYAAHREPMKFQLPPVNKDNNNTPIRILVLKSTLNLILSMFAVSGLFLLGELFVKSRDVCSTEK